MLYLALSLILIFGEGILLKLKLEITSIALLIIYSGLKIQQPRSIQILLKCHLNLRHALVRALTREDLPHHDDERKHVRFFRIVAVVKNLVSVTHTRKCLFKIYIKLKLRHPLHSATVASHSLDLCLDA
ncbi:hypothetical protein PsorP6_013975 [Peronosclerospora sorghi]|uniref:Uncharacterized protein n=1 Tax=Peronosclerospora sorghi TaxID=230839 RepID=A0ACC0VH55_9STRA|nr:hypothetical protein PsorP6_013975 [Peronosclerospora sorghi]